MSELKAGDVVYLNSDTTTKMTIRYIDEKLDDVKVMLATCDWFVNHLHQSMTFPITSLTLMENLRK